jgi:hypothetical protein
LSISQPEAGKQLIKYDVVSFGGVVKRQKEGIVKCHGDKFADPWNWVASEFLA